MLASTRHVEEAAAIETETDDYGAGEVETDGDLVATANDVAFVETETDIALEVPESEYPLEETESTV